MSILIEVAVATVEDAVVAQSAGADRLELCAALDIGGITPSLGTFLEIRQRVSLPVIAMVRPRGGGFVYGAGDFAAMGRDAEMFLSNGAAGVAFGFLTAERAVDEGRVEEIMRIVGERESVFHRAFDLTADALAGLDCLIDLGVTRVLTSGQQENAFLGSELIGRLIERAAGRVQILPGGGIAPENARELVRRTGARQLHGTFSEACDDPAFPVCTGKIRRTSGRRIRDVRATLNG